MAEVPMAGEDHRHTEFIGLAMHSRRESNRPAG